MFTNIFRARAAATHVRPSPLRVVTKPASEPRSWWHVLVEFEADGEWEARSFKILEISQYQAEDVAFKRIAREYGEDFTSLKFTTKRMKGSKAQC